MTDELTPTEGMNRREMLKRSALVGGAGALMWAAPTVTAFGPRAFAQEGTPDDTTPGAVSWVMVWFRCGTEYHIVKYEAKGNGYDENCGATKGNVSQDDVNCSLYFDVQDAKAAGLTRSMTCPPGVTSGASAEGALQISATGDCVVIGWVLHDGSCKKVEGNTWPACRSVENHLKDPANPAGGSVGPIGGALGSGGTFLWQKCR